MNLFFNIYRSLPLFKGKFRIGKILFKNYLDSYSPVTFTAHSDIKYKIPNTIENLGVELLINGIYEHDVVKFLKKIIKSGDVFLDVGANIGSIGLPVVKSKKDIKYYGFEASPVVFEYLEYNFNNNNIDNFKLYNNLIYEDDDKQMKFYQASKYGKSSLSPSYSDEYIFIKSTSIDNFCKANQIENIDLIKIDVQGYELFVFKGMRQMLLEKRVKNILFEFEDWAEKDAHLEIGSAQQYILGLGYELYDMNGNKLPGILKNSNTMIWAKPKAESKL